MVPSTLARVDEHAFSTAERQAVYRAIEERRGMPDDAEPVAVLCLGPVPDFPDRPAPEIDKWPFGRPLAEFVSENGWPTSSSGPPTSAVGLPTCP
jgi:hypothetical protein